MSAVKNLRAMFEQKGEVSSPERGRSPGIPYVPPGDNPRPLSKVRTSFIAIEKDGRIGLQREGSQDSASATRKISGDSSVTTATAVTESSNPFDAVRLPAKTNLKSQPIPESPRADLGGKAAAPRSQETQKTKPLPSATTGTASKRPGPDGAVTKEGASANTQKREAKGVNGTKSEKEQQKATTKEASKPATRTVKPAPKPIAASLGTKLAGKPEKSPTVNNPPKSPAGTTTHYAAARKTPENKSQQPEKTVTPRATVVKKPPSLQSSPASAGFVKPKPKSPTRPVRLPPGLTTHTASSGSKVNAPRQSLSRASGTFLPVDSHGRSTSRASVSAAGAVPAKAAATQTLKRQSSTISRPRPSLGPPPKQPARDHPPTKQEKQVDEGFLARMMRPTQSSASKTTEKVVVTSPPRKTAAAAAPKKAATAKPVKRAAAAAPKPEATASSTEQQQQQQTSAAAAAAAQIAAEAEHATAAEEVVETAKAAEGEAGPLPADAGQKSTAQEVAPVAEQSETAEQVIAAAEEVGDEVSAAPAPSEAVETPEELAENPVQRAVEAAPEPTDAVEEPVTNGDGDGDKAETAVPEGEEAVSVEKAADSGETAAAEEKGAAEETEVA